MLKTVGPEVIHLVVDDPVVLRASKKTPGRPDSSPAREQAEPGGVCEGSVLGEPGLGDSAGARPCGLAVVAAAGSGGRAYQQAGGGHGSGPSGLSAAGGAESAGTGRQLVHAAELHRIDAETRFSCDRSGTDRYPLV